MNPTSPEFWDLRYRAKRTPWDMNGVPPILVDFLRRHRASGRVLIPGCGSGYEIGAFVEAGWNVTAIDFSAAAVARARERFGQSGADVRVADFFGDDLGDPFDLVYERTFLCSMPPDRWPAYAAQMARLLKTGGLLAGIFAYGSSTEGPPFFLKPNELASLLGRAFERDDARAVPSEQSLPLFAGAEWWETWRKTERRASSKA